MIFGNLGKMGEMLKQAKQIKDELSKARFEAESGGVRAVVNGEMDIVELKITPGMDSFKAESAAKEAVNKALRTAKAEAAKLMSKMTGGLQLPGK